MIYKINVFEKLVTKYNPKGEDFSGEQWSMKIENLKGIPFRGLTKRNIANGLRELIYADIKEEEIIAENGKLGIIGVIENGEGNKDIEGEYLCDYFFEVVPVGEPIDLEELFLKGEQEEKVTG